MKSSTSSVNPICEMNRCFSQPKHEMSDNSPHPDYLGNTGFITDITGRPYQHFFYSPFGEELVSQHAGNGNYDSPYRFNAKEVDPETGYYYYGARYYNSNLSMWISVDPLADKYPSLTPYAFVANNPVMLYDPDGRDIFTIDSDGNVSREVNKKQDLVITLDTDGNETGREEFEYGSIKSVFTDKVRYPSNNENGDDGSRTMTMFKVKGDGNAEKLHQFFADQKKYEYGRCKVGYSGTNIVGTTYDEDKSGLTSYLIQKGWTVTAADHNHPNGTHPSGADVRNLIKFQEKTGRDIKSRVLVSGFGYTPYNSNTNQHMNDHVNYDFINSVRDVSMKTFGL